MPFIQHLADEIARRINEEEAAGALPFAIFAGHHERCGNLMDSRQTNIARRITPRKVSAHEDVGIARFYTPGTDGATTRGYRSGAFGLLEPTADLWGYPVHEMSADTASDVAIIQLGTAPRFEQITGVTSLLWLITTWAGGAPFGLTWNASTDRYESAPQAGFAAFLNTNIGVQLVGNYGVS